MNVVRYSSIYIFGNEITEITLARKDSSLLRISSTSRTSSEASRANRWSSRCFCHERGEHTL